jgi:hypothetical protein
MSSHAHHANAGVYGVDWWNIYLPLKILTKLDEDIKKCTGYCMNQEGIIMDKAQGLASITVNIRDIKDSPNITMIVEYDNDHPPDLSNPSVTVKDGLVYTKLGTLIDVMDDNGEESLIAGMGFFSVGVVPLLRYL